MPDQNWRLLRKKNGTGNDPDWSNLQRHPNSVAITVGGTASDGTYSITFAPVAPGRPSVVASFVRGSGESNSAIATALGAAVDALNVAGGTLEDFVESTSVAGAVVTIILKTTAPRFTFTLAAPGSGTLVGDPVDEWPIVAELRFNRGAQLGQMTAVEFAFVAVDSSDEPVVDDNGMTLTLEVVDLVPRTSRYGSGATVGVTSSVPTALHPIDRAFRMPINGSFAVGLYMHTLANSPTGYDDLEVWYREVVA